VLRPAGWSGYLELRVRQRGLAFRAGDKLLDNLRDAGVQKSLIEAVCLARVGRLMKRLEEIPASRRNSLDVPKLNDQDHFSEAEAESERHCKSSEHGGSPLAGC
jgi:hypothetical protein